MREIVYSEHLKTRLELREIPYNLPKRIYERSTERYRDRQTELSIAIGRSAYRGRVREFTVVYREVQSTVILVTIHPLKPQQKFARARQARWEHSHEERQ